MMNPRYFVLGDIHGRYDLLLKLYRLMLRNGFSFKRGDILVQLGDRCDRGDDTFRVNIFFYKLEKRYPGQVICLMGNHEAMMLDAMLKDDIMGFMYNGGKATMKSYKCYSNNPAVLLYKMQDCGHLKWHDAQPHFYETDKYLFTHAPIPQLDMRLDKDDFRNNKSDCYWSYGGENLEWWVDPEPVEGKISVHGHIHGIHSERLAVADEKGNMKIVDKVFIPGIRQIGNSFMIDTGAGCHKDGYLTCLELPSMTAYTSRGEVLIGEYEK